MHKLVIIKNEGCDVGGVLEIFEPGDPVVG
jgi:hypothetical protein